MDLRLHDRHNVNGSGFQRDVVDRGRSVKKAWSCVQTILNAHYEHGCVISTTSRSSMRSCQDKGPITGPAPMGKWSETAFARTC
jgi:hypothetical protein